MRGELSLKNMEVGKRYKIRCIKTAYLFTWDEKPTDLAIFIEGKTYEAVMQRDAFGKFLETIDEQNYVHEITENYFYEHFVNEGEIIS